MTTGIVHSTSLWPALQNSQSLFFPTSKRKKKTTTKHTNTNIAIFFFFTVTWKHSPFHRCCATAEPLLSASHLLPIAEPEIPLPNHCSEPYKRLLDPNSSVPYTHTPIFHPALRVLLGIIHPFPRESVKFQGHIHTGCLNTEGCSLYSLDPNFSAWHAMEKKRLFQLPSDLPIALLWSSKTGEPSSPAGMLVANLPMLLSKRRLYNFSPPVWMLLPSSYTSVL